jgi:acetyl esterase/lipase
MDALKEPSFDFPQMPTRLQIIMLRFSSLLVSAAALLNSCTSFSAAPGVYLGAVNSDFVLNKDIVFTPPNWPAPLIANLYKPESASPTPAVLLIHGGGWNEKERRGDMTGIAKNLAKRGYFVMNTTYRLTPEWQFPAQKKDIDLALRYIRENAVDLNIAALAGLDPKNDIKAIVAGGAPVDLSFWPEGKLTGLLLGGPLKGNEKLYREASPVTYVRPTSPPVFIYHGSTDTLVPTTHPKAFIRVLEKNKVEHEVYWIKGRSHIMSHLFSAGAIPEAITFLDEHLKKQPSE